MRADTYFRLVNLGYPEQLYIERCCSATDGQGRPTILALYGPFSGPLVLDSAGEVKVSLVDLLTLTRLNKREWLHPAIYKPHHIIATWEEDPCAAQLA